MTEFALEDKVTVESVHYDHPWNGTIIAIRRYVGSVQYLVQPKKQDKRGWWAINEELKLR